MTCTLCPLHEGATSNCVGGDGPRPCDLLVVGEAPGATEDRRGLPFQGRSGKLLRTILGAVADDLGVTLYSESDSGPIVAPGALMRVRYTNVVRCRPPKNRDPKSNEVQTCMAAHFWKEVAEVDPKLILTVGKVPAEAIVDRKVKLKEHRCLVFHIHNRPVIITYDPGKVLKNHRLKDYWYADITRAMEFVR